MQRGTLALYTGARVHFWGQNLDFYNNYLNSVSRGIQAHQGQYANIRVWALMLDFGGRISCQTQLRSPTIPPSPVKPIHALITYFQLLWTSTTSTDELLSQITLAPCLNVFSVQKQNANHPLQLERTEKWTAIGTIQEFKFLDESGINLGKNKPLG